MMEVFYIFLLLCLSAFFSGSETAFFSLSHWRLENLIAEKKSWANHIFSLLRNPYRFLITILVGNTLVNVLASSFAETIASIYLHEIGLYVAILSMTILIVIFGEVAPKTLAYAYSESFARFARFPMTLLNITARPIHYILELIPMRTGDVTHSALNGSSPVTSEGELQTLLTVVQEAGVIDPHEEKIARRVFHFGELTVKVLMVPRTEMIAVEESEDIEAAISLIKGKGYSRLPVYRGSLDNIIGICYSLDLLNHYFLKNDDGKKVKVGELVQKAFFVPEMKRGKDLLKEFQRKQIQIAIAVDEHGGTSGLITVEDLLEELVGEIYDEYDQPTIGIKWIGKGRWQVSGRLPISQFNARFNTDIEKKGFNTINGYLIDHFGYIPSVGEKVQVDSIEIIVVNVHRARITSIIVIQKER